MNFIIHYELLYEQFYKCHIWMDGWMIMKTKKYKILGCSNVYSGLTLDQEHLKGNTM